MKKANKVAMLGFDCALTPLVRKHIDEGVLPNFKKIFDNGTVAENCLVPYPTITPPNWTCMATGAWPITNQICDFWRHIPGTAPENANTHTCLNLDHCKAETIWEAAAKAGKKSVILNYPMSYNAHKKVPSATVVGGASMTPGCFLDEDLISQLLGTPLPEGVASMYTFCDDIMFSTETYPGTCAKVKFVKAQGWQNVPDMGDDALECAVDIPFNLSLSKPGKAIWYWLVRDLGNGYEYASLSPSKDFKDAFFTVKPGEWTPAFTATCPLADGGSKKVRFKGKFMGMDDDATNFKLFLNSGLSEDGELWCYPPEKAAGMNKGNNCATNNTLMAGMSLGWIDEVTWLENIENHYDWMGDTVESLLGGGDWDLFFTHAHPTDYFYHVFMAELNTATCTSKEAYDKAWNLHRRLYIAADRYLGRMLKLFTDQTLVVLISDHGATPDGPHINMFDVLGKAGLTIKKETPIPDWIEGCPEAIREVFITMASKIDASKSKAIPQRMCFVYVNLKGRDPGGIVEPEDYEKVQREIIDTLMTYVDPKTGKRPFILALPKKEAMLIGQGGDQCGDVVYALWPEYSEQHGSILPTSTYGEMGDMRALSVFYGPEIGIKKGYAMKRVSNIVDYVPTICYLTGWPIPKDAEGSVLYQIMENPNKD